MRQDLELILRQADELEKQLSEFKPRLRQFNILLVQELIVLCDGQNKAARQLGLSPAYLSKVARGHEPLTIELAARVARSFPQKKEPEITQNLHGHDALLYLVKVVSAKDGPEKTSFRP